jgi:hypothetical protein
MWLYGDLWARLYRTRKHIGEVEQQRKRALSDALLEVIALKTSRWIDRVSVLERLQVLGCKELDEGIRTVLRP